VELQDFVSCLKLILLSIGSTVYVVAQSRVKPSKEYEFSTLGNPQATCLNILELLCLLKESPKNISDRYSSHCESATLLCESVCPFSSHFVCLKNVTRSYSSVRTFCIHIQASISKSFCERFFQFNILEK
jgi:hypothetical protein